MEGSQLKQIQARPVSYPQRRYLLTLPIANLLATVYPAMLRKKLTQDSSRRKNPFLGLIQNIFRGLTKRLERVQPARVSYLRCVEQFQTL